MFFFPFPHFANQGIKPAWLAQGRNLAVSPHKKENISGEGGELAERNLVLGKTLREENSTLH